MMENKNVKFSELVKDTLNIKDLSNIIGGGGFIQVPGMSVSDGCQSGICPVKINLEYCGGGTVLTHGIAG